MENTEPKRTLTIRQIRAIPFIVGGKTALEGVKKAKIGKTTYYGWMKQPEFKKEVNRQKNELIKQSLFDLKLSSKEAVKVLIELLKSDNETIRLKTALSILEYAKVFMEQDEIIERLKNLEEQLNLNK